MGSGLDSNHKRLMLNAFRAFALAATFFFRVRVRSVIELIELIFYLFIGYWCRSGVVAGSR